jgi:membrane-bound lytic murein transglycosylase D
VNDLKYTLEPYISLVDGTLSRKPYIGSFPYPDELRPQVEFWKKIFSQYTTRQAVIHDNWYVEVIYTVVDLSGNDLKSEADKRKAVDKAIEKYGEILEELEKKGGTVETMTEEEKAIYMLFRKVSENGLDKEAKDRIRGQIGQKDRIMKGITISGQYVEEMERIFREANLPVELTRLPFIESAFNIHAYSFVGAAGLWQFMKYTGKSYMRIDNLVDERRDPIKATEAATKLLAANYKQLGSWPLAITAYNHGAGGMQKAIAQIKSKDIADIILKYKGDGFGFASRNFYPEFLAVLEIMSDPKTYFGDVPRNPPLRYDEVVIKDYIKMSDVITYCSISEEDLRTLNPALREGVFSSRYMVPKNYVLKIPSGSKANFEVKYAQIPSSQKYASLDSMDKKHKVKSGQSLSAIAKLYKTSIKAIMAANSLKNRDRIKPGQVLRIPGKLSPASADENDKDDKKEGFLNQKIEDRRLKTV